MLTTLERHVCDAIASREDNLLVTLSEWVGMSTGPHAAHEDTLRALDAQRASVLARLEDLGATISLVPGDTRPDWLREGTPSSPHPTPQQPPPLAIARHWHAEPTVLLCGHIDTVHAPSVRTPSGEPFDRLRVDGTRATGPGCADMKGGLLVAIAALEALAEAGVVLSWGFALVSDEETGTFAGNAALQAEAREGYRAGLIFEPALPDGSLVIERPGSGQFVIEATGKAAHVGRDFAKGVSAVNALARAVLGAADIADVDSGRIVSVGPLQGGSASNIVPDHARAWGNMRFMSDDAQHIIEARLRELATDGQGLPSVRVRSLVNRPRKPATPAVRQLATLAQQCAGDLGQQLPLGTTGGVCDGNNLQAAGLPVIDTLGVRGGGLHTNVEWIELPSLVQRAQLTALVLLRGFARRESV